MRFSSNFPELYCHKIYHSRLSCLTHMFLCSIHSRDRSIYAYTCDSIGNCNNIDSRTLAYILLVYTPVALHLYMVRQNWRLGHAAIAVVSSLGTTKHCKAQALSRVYSLSHGDKVCSRFFMSGYSIYTVRPAVYLVVRALSMCSRYSCLARGCRWLSSHI